MIFLGTKNEFRSINNQILPRRELNIEQVVVRSDLFNVEIKEEIDISEENFQEHIPISNNTKG